MTPANRRVKGSSASPSAAPAPPSTVGGSPSRVASVLGTLVGVLAVCATSVGVAWTARRYITQSPRFSVVDIQVGGEEHRSSDALIAESGLTLGANVFSADLDAARARVLADPWIAEAAVTRKLPGTLSIQVTERKPAAIVALDQLFLASDDGVPFKPVELADSFDLPVITGMSSEDVARDRQGAARTVRRAIELAAEFEHGPLSKRLPLQEVHAATDGTFALVVGHAGTELVLGAPPFRRKLEQASRVVAELDRRGAKADAVLLDNDTRPDRVVVRIR